MKYQECAVYCRRGSTLLAVFWIMAVMSLAVVASMRVVSYQVDVVDSQLGGVEAVQYAERGVAIASNSVVERWDPLLRQNFENGGFQARIISEGARFNINHIILSEDKALLRLMFTEWGIDLDVAAEIADALKDWVDQGDTEELNGAEAPYYENQGFVNYPFNRPFYHLDEMRLVRGMDIVESFQPEWRDWFTVWSDGGLDLTAANAELIQVAIQGDIEDAQKIVEFADGPDGIRFTEDDPQSISVAQVEELTGISDGGQGLLNLRINSSGGNNRVTRIESVGFVGDVRRRIVLIITNRNNPQILDRRVEFVQ